MKEQLEKLVDDFVDDVFFVFMTHNRSDVTDAYKELMKTPERAESAKHDWLVSMGETRRMDDLKSLIWSAISRTIPVSEHIGSMEMKSFWRNT